MTDKEITGFINDVIMLLWPNWQINKEQLKAWTKSLRHFNFDISRIAAEEHYASKQGQYREPKLYDIIERARLIKNDNFTGQKPAVHFEPNVFVQCVEHKKDPTKIGQFYPVIPPVKFYRDADYILRAAENARKKFEACYGGKWITLQKTSYAKMQERRRISS
jgi:hypothetical protein